MTKRKIFLIAVGSLLIGIVIGGYLFSQTQPRSFLSLKKCDNCLSPSDLGGLIASIGIQKFPGMLPSVVFETDKTIVIRHPSPKTRIHYVIIPKRDIKNVGDISEENAPYFIDAFAVTQKLIQDEKLSRYRFYSNGPGYQTVTYLHFHLIAK